ncbi:exodeoxyribonuclease V subunit gamma [Pandoraea captiosa]|uniref:RecBCD enzyme subunit RecC n=1 Tax=Pandoraea captiosa TaxID=2508302 RepID=A0A5E5AG13_9BURK|nr:exodeoxyribonuclease V subunit gamma [Pandoraea captiosa]VVE72158.1 exodeoxyribonuclease V subunit gamma [Pandoraea captiosa]
MLHLFFSNRFTTLEAALLRDIALAPGAPSGPVDPFETETIVVPSVAVRRRLELDYADIFGVCANVRLTYLAQWLWDMAGKLVTVPESSPFAPDRLVWPLYQCLAKPWVEASPRLAGYLAGADDVMRFELADRLAHIYDQYLTYRPDWLERWQSGETIAPGAATTWGDVQRADEAWQSALWRQVLAHLEIRERHPTLRAIDRIEQLTPETIPVGWPSRVSVFALSSMPPLSMALLKAMSRLIDVHLYVLNPCESYWFDIVPPSRLSYLTRRDGAAHREVGHPLLAEWGRQTQSHIDALYADLAPQAVEDRALFQPNPAPTLLAALQNGILTLDDGRHGVPDGVGADGSVQVHVCHSLARQIEVLHDQLLACFDEIPDLRPDDVLITVPDLGRAAPLIDAVFGTSTPRIPYLVTGLPPTRTNPVARAFASILALPQQRVAASSLVELARTEAVAQRYDLGGNVLDAIQNWLHAAGARRGWRGDALLRLEGPGAKAMKGRTGDVGDDVVPALERHTLGDAMMRLFLGYALPDDAMPVDDWLPVGGIEGGRAELLGQLARLIDDLDATTVALQTERTGLAWRDQLLAMLEQFFSDEPRFADDVAEVRMAIEQIGSAIADGAPEVQVPVEVVARVLADALDDPTRGGVPSGRVTFAAIPSLRLLPYRVVCMIGMDDGVLPGRVRADEFDLMRALPQRGDRQRRDDERNLFLDLMLSAQDRFLITYTGRSVRDNAPLPPSTAVDELLDFTGQLLAPVSHGFSLDDQREARERLVVLHPLQPFSPKYFDGEAPSLYSYDVSNGEAAQQLADQLASPTPNRPTQPFVREPLPGVAQTHLTLDDLLRFWRHPSRAWARDRLGLSLNDMLTEVEDDEPFVLDWAGRDALAARLLPRLLRDDEGDGRNARANAQAVERIASVSHELPGGATGAVWRRRELGGLRALATQVRQAQAEGTHELLVTLPLAPTLPPAWQASTDSMWHGDATLSAACLLQGRLAPVSRHGLVMYRYGSMRPSDLLAAWLAHLALCAHLQQPEHAGLDVAARTLWYGEDETFALRPVDDAARLLAQWVALYRLGQTRPLPFFVRSAWKLASTGKLADAQSAWQGSAFARGDADDPYTRLIWRGVEDPLAEPFELLANTMFGPMVQHLELVEGA